MSQKPWEPSLGYHSQTKLYHNQCKLGVTHSLTLSTNHTQGILYREINYMHTSWTAINTCEKCVFRAACLHM